jgi:hypothetical protein
LEGSSSEAGSKTTRDVFPARSLSNAIPLFYALARIIPATLDVGMGEP